VKDTDINIMQTVEEVVSRYFPTVQLSSPSRRANYVQARQYFAWICTKLNVPETYIAEYLNRNHASIYRMNMNTQNYICLYTTFRKNIINIDVRPSFSATYDIAQKTMKESYKNNNN